MFRFFMLILIAFSLMACASAGPYVPPPECAEADSVILEKFPDPRVLDKGLMTAQLMAFKLVPGYDYEKAEKVLTELEKAVNDIADLTYAQLLVKLTEKIDYVNQDAGAVVLIMGVDVGVLESPTRIQPCDRVLINQEFARQRLLISLYAPS